MKSQQQDQKIRTSCKDCAFAIYEDGGKTQISCVHDRIARFEPEVVTPAYDEEKEFYLIERLCTYYRDTRWGYSSSDTEKVKKESSLSFDIIFNCNNIDDTKTTSIINFINNHRYYNEKVNVLILHESEYYSQVKDNVKKVVRGSNGRVDISVCSSIEEHMHKLLKKTKNAYHALIDNPTNLELDILIKLNNVVNENLQKFVVAESNGTKFVGNFSYKMLNGFNPSVNYFANVNSVINDAIDSSLYIRI